MEEQTPSELAPAASLEERVLAKFDKSPIPEKEETQEASSEPPEETTESEQTEESLTGFEEVEFEGSVYQVPTELKNALMHHADYTQKTQQLARNRENLELQQKQIKEFQEQQQFQVALSQELNQLSALDYQIQQYKALNWAEMQDSEVMRRRLELESLKEQREEIHKGIDGKKSEFSRQQQERLNGVLAEAQEILRKSIPNWSEALAAEISEYALSKGYTQHEVSNVTNPRDVETLWKAYQFDKLSSSKDAALKRAAKAPPVIKPGARNPMPKTVQDKLNFRKAIKGAKSDQQRAQLIEQRLVAKFGG